MATVQVPPENFHIFDTTLRDGAYQNGFRLSVQDKITMAGYLDELGVSFIEGGSPGMNPIDNAFFTMAAKRLVLNNAKLVAFGSIRKSKTLVSNNPQVVALRQARAAVVCLAAESYDVRVQRVHQISLAENLTIVIETVSHLVNEGKQVFVDCEHFFDAFYANSSYALDVVRAAAEAGAEVVILCDTNGGMLPSLIGDAVSAAAAIGVDMGIHCHNDSGCAVANTLAAVEAGVMHIQGTINGYGERAGIADLTSVIPNLQLKYGWQLLTPQQLASLTRVSHAIAAVVNEPDFQRQPYVGKASFAQDMSYSPLAVKEEKLIQHIWPELVGNDKRVLISDLTRSSNIHFRSQQLGLNLTDPELILRISEKVAEKQAKGYCYQAAEASFELLMRREISMLPELFLIQGWRVFTEHRSDGSTTCEATLKLIAGRQHQATVGEGNGPINALDCALREALTPVYPVCKQYRLTGYRVRIMDESYGSDAIVQVLVDTSCADRVWTTVGVGSNVIEASWEALLDAYTYGLVQSSVLVGE